MNQQQSANPDERELVLSILLDHMRTHKYSNVLVRRALDAHPEFTAEQKAFVKRLAEGTIEREIELDGIIRRFLKDPKTQLKPRVRAVLRMAVYEIYYMDSVTDYAAVNEAVVLLKRTGLVQQAGFVNAVLRSVCRERAAMGTVTQNNGSTNIVTGAAGKGKIHRRRVVIVQSGKAAAADVNRASFDQPAADMAATAGAEADQKARNIASDLSMPGSVSTDDQIRQLSQRYSMPESIVALWLDDYGPEVTEKLLASMLQIRPVSIRFDPRVSEEERRNIIGQLEKAGVTVSRGRWLSYAYTLEHTGNVQQLPGFAEGKWTVQDESSMMVCEAAGLAKAAGASGDDQNGQSPAENGDHKMAVLDLCAAPGGKSLHAASLIPEGTVYSFDLTREKTDRIRENAARMRLSNLVVEEHDATEYDPALEGKADVVLCDVPCSGLGVMTRKKDIKYHFSPEKIRSLTALQKKILRNAVNYVRPGGVLIYSTCTIDKAENDRMAAFIANKLGMKPDPLTPFLPSGIPGIAENQLQLLPYLHHTDGFFMARFRR